ncbi:MAG: GxxExxY protein [Chitinophagaceae bacterium]|nr:GxxExxY protein [Chitinophagaceae bacterium]
MENFLFKEETYQIIGICMDVQKTLGFGFSEAVYKDAMEFEYIDSSLPHLREKELEVNYKGQILRHRFFADFICYNKIIVEVKSSANGIVDDHIAQTLNYLRVSDNAIGLIINFGKRRLEYERLIL